MTASTEVRATSPAPGDRRQRRERRHRRLWSLLYGGFNPRRRDVRRLTEQHAQILDWHHPHLLGVALAILLLSCADAFLTLNLLVQGAREVNPVMAGLLDQDVAMFIGVKMALTGIGVVTLVALSRYRVFGRIRVDLALYLSLFAYALLFAYELRLLDPSA